MPEKKSKRWPLVMRVLRSAALVYVAVCTVVYLMQRRMQYLPDASEVPLPRHPKYGGIEEAALTTSDGVSIRAWHWPGERDPTLLFFHGNAGHRGHRLEWMESFHDLGYGVAIFDYRGYGGSGGSPTEAGLYLDAEAALAWLAGRGARRVSFVAESLGCGVAVEMAARRPPVAMVLHAGYPSLADVAAKHYPWLPVKLLMRDRYDCAGKIGRIGCPLLMVHGERDDIIPAALGRRLFEAAPEPREWHLIEDAGHNDMPWSRPREYLEKVAGFLERHAAGGN
jgi:hypothetical protein